MKVQPIVQPIKNTLPKQKIKKSKQKIYSDIKDTIVLAGMIGVPVIMAELACKLSRKINPDDRI